jgi:plastin-3
MLVVGLKSTKLHWLFRYYIIFVLYLIIFQIGLFNQITLENCPGLTTLLLDGERIEDLMKLSPEAILLRWVNHHLERAGVAR